MLTTNRLTHKDKPWHVPWPRTLAAKLVTKELTTPLIRHAAISKEETTTLKPLTALAISVVVLMPRGATVSTFQEDSHTWIHRIHARRDNSGEGRPNRLHGIFLDAQTGKVQSRKEWSVPRPRGGIIPAGDGKFVVLTPAMVALYSPGFDLLKDFRLSPEQQSQLWDFHASPTGKS